MKLETAVVFLIFNRPEITKRVFSEIRKAKPTKLFVVADGPRPNYPDDIEKCEAVRAIIEQVDWECDVHKNYSSQNFGCKMKVSSGLDWVFSHVEDAIILEDDCLPHPTFFRYCQELLGYYRNDNRIMMISGDNFQFGKKRGPYSYYFSKFSHIWGWATWKRAWNHYDINMSLWPVLKKHNLFNRLLQNSNEMKYWGNLFERVYTDKINSWDYQFIFACWINHGLNIIPNVNLISNLGFNNDGTHTKKSNILANLALKSMQFPIVHPPFILPDYKADNFTYGNFINPGLITRIKNKITRIIRKDSSDNE